MLGGGLDAFCSSVRLPQYSLVLVVEVVVVVVGMRRIIRCNDDSVLCFFFDSDDNLCLRASVTTSLALLYSSGDRPSSLI